MTAIGSPCGPGWRVESAALGSGTVQAALKPASFDVQNLLVGVGTGTFTVHPGDISNLRHVWPHAASVWVTYFDEFIWAGMIQGLSMQNGALSVGCVSLEGYLNLRKLRQTYSFAGVDQNEIGATLVEYARTSHGVPLYGAALPSSYFRDRTYDSITRPNLLEQVTALTGVENGPEWRLTGVRNAGKWSATMTFADKWGVTKDITIVSDYHAPDYGLEVTSDDHVTVFDALSDGELPLIATAQDLPYPVGNSAYVEFDKSETFSGVTDLDTLQQQADGALARNSEPFVTPRAILSGREATQGLGIKLGDTVEARLCLGGIRYEGPSRVIGETWHAAADNPTTRELMLSPNGRPSHTLFDQPPCTTCVDC